MLPKANKIFILKKKIKEAVGVITLRFFPLKQEGFFSFQPGQYVVVRFLNNFLNTPGKAYTITSPPGEKFIAITVKRLGKFSNALCDLRIGDRVKIIGPYGHFFPRDKMKNIVFLAGGIGVTPFFNIIKSFSKEKKMDKETTLFYSNKTKNDIAFFKELNKLSKKWNGLKIVYILTREKKTHPLIKEFRRIDIKMLKKYLKRIGDYYYFICGSTDFVDYLWKELKTTGIKENHLITETFY